MSVRIKKYLSSQKVLRNRREIKLTCNGNVKASVANNPHFHFFLYGRACSITRDHSTIGTFVYCHGIGLQEEREGEGEGGEGGGEQREREKRRRKEKRHVRGINKF